MNNQETLLNEIRKQLSPSSSLNDAIAVALDISYDAAHRRVSGKSKFSIDETILLCQHYNLSLDTIFHNEKKMVVEKTKEVNSEADLVQYFKDSATHLSEFANSENLSIFYSAKDIPLFYTIGGSLLSKFKLYVWLNLLIGKENISSFESFTISNQLQEHSSLIQNVFAKATVHEIWNETTINSTIQQILYFFESGLLSINNATELYQDVKNMLLNIEEKSSQNDIHYHLYQNDLLILNNSVLVKNNVKSKLFIPYTMLGYFITDDLDTTKNASEYFKYQMKNSKSLNLSGTRDRKLFFNKAHQKVDYYIQRLNNQIDLLF
ncbi:hypothetical protein IVB69_03595 [Flavobacterium sp. J49]|uniref:hypothetical protein n=1 Tax=Flavobacterium sp. J49 TaxID=2718534 RepID=UPI0015934A1C|nr:hypothetical protein [Flavobacterium sp. J49]MBF6640554.1 hypothetical protein [Flavobacterium sp. J49]NIC01801.1 hypothetical protein [Flavobacterium sp. J49]